MVWQNRKIERALLNDAGSQLAAECGASQQSISKIETGNGELRFSLASVSPVRSAAPLTTCTRRASKGGDLNVRQQLTIAEVAALGFLERLRSQTDRQWSTVIDQARGGKSAGRAVTIRKAKEKADMEYLRQQRVGFLPRI